MLDKCAAENMFMMKLLIFAVLVALTLAKNGNEGMNFRKEGTYMIGAIIPLTYDNGSGKCDTLSPEGISDVEAMALALRDIEKSSEFASMRKDGVTFGYDFRDSCDKLNTEKGVAYNIVYEAHDYKTNKSNPKPADVVISEFTKKSVKLLMILNAENIPQVSYYHGNARLQKDSSISPSHLTNLISAYPSMRKKMLAIVDIVKEFEFQHVYSVATDDAQGHHSMELLSKELNAYKICNSNGLFLTKDNIKSVLSSILKNRKIKVVIIDTSKDLELEFYKEAHKQGIFDLIFISTQKWNSHPELLKPYHSVVEGLISVEDVKHSKNFKDSLRNRMLPFYDSPWLKKLFISMGGEESCFTANSPDKACISIQNKLQEKLVAKAENSIYAYDSIYVIAKAKKKAYKNKEKMSLVEATKELRFRIPLEPNNLIYFTEDHSVEASNFYIYQVFYVRGNVKSKYESEWLGNWNNGQKVRNLPLVKDQLRWKNESKKIPTSVCSEACPASYKRSFFEDRCCWSCSKCPNGTVSNKTNADECITCGKLSVPDLDQTKCVKYQLMYFRWFGPVGALIIVLMFIAITLVLFSFGIFSQKTSHELIAYANYNSLCFFLLGCLLLTLAPIPLLLKPSTTLCATYISLFNVALSICLGVLVSRSAYMEGFFDENNELTKGTLGSYPRGLVVGVIVITQIIINIVGSQVEPPSTLHSTTDYWNRRYHECSSWASMTFWVGFVYNVLISVIGNSLSCSSVNMEDHSQELKRVLHSHLCFYIFGIIELILFYRVVDEQLAGGQGVLCILFALAFYFCYIWPKIFIILFRSSGDKPIEKQLEEKEDDSHSHPMTAIHASAGFKHQGIVQMKIRDSTVNRDSTITA